MSQSRSMYTCVPRPRNKRTSVLRSGPSLLGGGAHRNESFRFSQCSFMVFKITEGLTSSSSFFPTFVETRALWRNATQTAICGGTVKKAPRCVSAAETHGSFLFMRLECFQSGHWEDRLWGSSVLMMYVGKRANRHGVAYFIGRPLNHRWLWDTLVWKYLILNENQLSFQVVMRIPDLPPAHLIGSARFLGDLTSNSYLFPLQINRVGVSCCCSLGPDLSRLSRTCSISSELHIHNSNFYLGEESHTVTSCGNPFPDPLFIT